MTKPRTNQGAQDDPKSTVESKPPENPPKEGEIPEDTLAAASTTRDPTIINRTS
jgi:organic hydroperoxide reductase OsmC/OhrA